MTGGLASAMTGRGGEGGGGGGDGGDHWVFPEPWPEIESVSDALDLRDASSDDGFGRYASAMLGSAMLGSDGHASAMSRLSLCIVDAGDISKISAILDSTRSASMHRSLALPTSDALGSRLHEDNRRTSTKRQSVEHAYRADVGLGWIADGGAQDAVEQSPVRAEAIEDPVASVEDPVARDWLWDGFGASVEDPVASGDPDARGLGCCGRVARGA